MTDNGCAAMLDGVTPASEIAMAAPARMPTRILGASGMRVSEIALGTMMFGDQTDAAVARRILDHAGEHGVNFIDTANQYAKGASEEMLGGLLKGCRDRWIVATKAGNPTGAGANDQGQSRAHVMLAVENSLRRLQTDRIDLYYVHFPDPATRWENLVETYGTLIRQGKVREWGLSNVRGWHIAHVCHLARALGVPAPVAVQPIYNMTNRQAEVEVIPAAVQFGLGAVPYSPIARGILTGKYVPGAAPAAGTRAARADTRMMQTEWRPESMTIAERLRTHTTARGVSLVHWAVAWVLANRAVSSVLAGPRTFEQWTDYVGAEAYAWTADDEALANSLVPAGHASTPGFTDPRYPIEGRVVTVGAGRA
jgi:aryl-alcohol dehydrogenase-like predicted oxidoreductase